MIVTILFVVLLVLGGNSKVFHPQPSILEAESVPLRYCNNACLFNVSQTITEAYHTVVEALQQECTQSDGYQIALLDSQHIEHVIINISSIILIKGGKKAPTIWKVNNTCEEIIYLYTANLTLQNIEFQFSNISDSIQPNRYLVHAGKDDYYPYITLKQCVFQSTSGHSEEDILQFYCAYLFDVIIDKCIFNGSGTQIYSNISMIYASTFFKLKLLNSKFQNAAISSRFDPIFIYSEPDGVQITIQNCEFNNIYSNNLKINSTIQITGYLEHKVQIINNIFSNCWTNQSQSGVLFLGDYQYYKLGNEFIIEKNTFKNNTGNFTGSIFLYSKNQNSTHSFQNNKFFDSKNSLHDGIGKDAYFIFTNPPSGWTLKNIENITQGGFNGSTTNGGDNTILFYVQFAEYKNYQGHITLPQQVNNISIYIIIGISVGSVVIVAVIVSIVIGVVVYRKKSKLNLKRKFGQFRDPLGSYRSI